MNDRLMQRGRIVGLYEAGLRINQIANQVGVSRSKFQRWVDHFELGEPLTDRPRTGRPRVTTDDEDRELVNMLVVNPLTKRIAVGIADQVSNTYFCVEISCVRRD